MDVNEIMDEAKVLMDKMTAPVYTNKWQVVRVLRAVVRTLFWTFAMFFVAIYKTVEGVVKELGQWAVAYVLITGLLLLSIVKSIRRNL